MMKYFKNVLTEEELKKQYRKLVMTYHPDRGGSNDIMKAINYQYARYLKMLTFKPSSLMEVKVGCSVFVNQSKCIVTEVNGKYFKAKSLKTHREALFSKSTGYAMLNFKFKADIEAL